LPASSPSAHAHAFHPHQLFCYFIATATLARQMGNIKTFA
jgi:hypothetical protein